MADEPNKHMDEILRAYTEARRKGADLPLHPATRKMLHAEVARRFKAAPVRRPFWSRVRPIWPQLAFGSGLCAILLVAVLSLRQRPAEQERERALGGGFQPKKSAEAAQRAAQQNESGTVPASAPESLVKRYELKQKAEPGARFDTPAQPVPPLQTAVKKEELLARGNQPVSSRSELRETGVQDGASAPVALSSASANKTLQEKVAPLRALANKRASVTASAAQANDLSNLGDALRLHFVELPGAGQAASPQVLRSFQLEQQGDDLRFKDKDGSIYLGQVLPASPAPPAQQIQPMNPVNARSFGFVSGALQLAESTQNTAAYFFRAAGTNLTLAQPVTIEGRFLRRTNLAALADRAKDTSANPAGSVQMPGRARHAIIGKVTVAQTNEIPVNAVSVEPGN